MTDRTGSPVEHEVERLYTKYAPMVFRRCRRLLGDDEAALDAMQETFVNLMRRYGDLASVTGPSSLLYTMATHVCLNVLRDRKRHPEHADDKLLAAIVELGRPEEKTFLRQVFERFGARDGGEAKVIAVYYFVDEMTLEEIARVLSLSVSSVRRQLERFRKHLKEYEA